MDLEKPTDNLEEQIAKQKAHEKKYKRIESYIATTTNEIKHALFERRKSVQEYLMPELVLGRSEILDYEDILQLEQHLKSKTGPWNMCFSTSLDGYSLTNLYNKMDGLIGPVLLFVKDTKKNVFGALISDNIHISEDYYGSSESFVFTIRPKFQTYNSTSENQNFIKCNEDCMMIGSDDCGKKEKYGLSIRLDKREGHTQSSATFGNPPLLAENDGKFVIRSAECWYFSYIDDGNAK